MKRLLMMVACLLLGVSAQAASFDCAKASTKIEKMICDDGSASFEDENVDIAYLRALERTDDRRKLIQDQRDWLKNVRNVCTDADCLIVAYANRREALDAIPTRKCYWLEPPIKDDAGKRAPVEPICRVMEQNLNQFCSQPPMVCGLKIAPKFSQQFTLPTWMPLDPEASRALIEEFLRVPYERSGKQDDDASWAEKQPKLQAAFAKKRITFSQAQLDLYNLGRPQTAYRLDYGSCQADNPQLKDSSRWGEAIHHAEVKTQHAPEVIRQLYRQYFSVDRHLAEVFLYEGKVYDFIMHGYVSKVTGLGENQLVVNRHVQEVSKGNFRPELWMNNICIFNYQPVKGAAK